MKLLKVLSAIKQELKENLTRASSFDAPGLEKAINIIDRKISYYESPESMFDELKKIVRQVKGYSAWRFYNEETNEHGLVIDSIKGHHNMTRLTSEEFVEQCKNWIECLESKIS